MIAPNTLKLQILISVIAVMTIASVVIIYFVRKDTIDNVKKLNEVSIEKTSNFIEASLKDNFNYILRYKCEYIKRKKDNLKKDIDLIFNLHKYSRGRIESIFDYYSKLKRKNFILLNKKGDVLFSTDHSLDKYVKEKEYSMNEQFAVNTSLYRIEFFKRKEGLTIFTYYDIFEFTKRMEGKINEVESDLEKILDNTKIGEKGFSFIYDENHNKIIQASQPSRKRKDKCLREIIKKSTPNCNAQEEIFYKNFHSCGNETFVGKKECFKGFSWNYTVVLPKSEIEKPGNDLAKKLVFIIVLIIFFSVLFLAFMISKVTKPLAILSKKISKVPEHDFTGYDHSELLDGLPVATRNEAGQLAESFSFMIKELSDSIKQLVATTAVNERIESELNVARKIQLGVLPQDFSEPKQKDTDIHAYLNPAREIGGDLYDFFFINEDHLCFTIGDVADKGVSAALFMFCAKKMISNYAFKGGADRPSPAEIMGEINEMLCKDNANFMFITLFIGILNVKNGKMIYANGGHVPPIFVDCGSEPKYRKDTSGPAVGIRPGIQYRDLTAVMQPGGAVFLCTDGVTEAMDEKDKLFGDKRLLDDFSSMKDKSCQEVVDGILYEVKMHAGKAPQSDDIAMLMLRWGVKEEEGENHV